MVSHSQQCHVGINVNHWYVIIISIHIMLLFAFSCAELWIIFIAAPQEGFIVLHVWEIVGTKSLTIFKGYHYSRFFIMISSSYCTTETNNLNSDPVIPISLVLGTTSPAAHWLSKRKKWSWNRSSHSQIFRASSNNDCKVSRRF